MPKEKTCSELLPSRPSNGTGVIASLLAPSSGPTDIDVSSGTDSSSSRVEPAYGPAILLFPMLVFHSGPGSEMLLNSLSEYASNFFVCD